jgi:RNA polymerase sigma-70 factor (ECF subfamily)
VELSDEALLEKYERTKDVTLFTTLVRRYQTRVYNAAVRFLGQTEEAEEVVQDTFLKVHQNLGKFRREASFGAWVFRIAHNQCFDKLRNKQRRKGFQFLSFDPQESDEYIDPQSPVVTQIADPSLSPSQQLDADEQGEVVSRSLNQLPDTQRAVLVLHDIEGFSYQEIAEIVGTNIGTVRSRLHYGRLKLKELLDPYFSNTSNVSATPR